MRFALFMIVLFTLDFLYPEQILIKELSDAGGWMLLIFLIWDVLEFLKRND